MADPTRKSTPGAKAHARVDPEGRLVAGDNRVLDRAAAGRSRVMLPDAGRTGWMIDLEAREAIELRPIDDGFLLSQFLAVPTALTADDMDRVDSANFIAVTRAHSLDEAVHLMCSDFIRRSDLDTAALVLIDRDGSPTFAGGVAVDHVSLAAMERTRRNGAPMAIWQAFNEDRVVLDPQWFDSARRDARFAPVSTMFGRIASGTFVAIPLRIDHRPIGVLSGIVDGDRVLGPSDLMDLVVLADRMALAIRYSEAIRRSRIQGSNEERSRIQESLHATVAQDAFVLSLEVARVNAVADETIRSHLVNLEAMSEQLLSDVRAVIDDSQVIESGGDIAGRLGQLVQDTRARSLARVDIDLDVEWESLSSRFGEDVVRVIAEGLRNAVKHGAPSEILVRARLERDTGWLRLTIVDRGDGHHESPGSTGVGLALVRRVVEQRGGTVTTMFGAEGARLTVEMPAEYESEWAVAQRHLKGS